MSKVGTKKTSGNEGLFGPPNVEVRSRKSPILGLKPSSKVPKTTWRMPLRPSSSLPSGVCTGFLLNSCHMCIKGIGMKGYHNLPAEPRPCHEMSGQNDTGGPQLTSRRSMHTWVTAQPSIRITDAPMLAQLRALPSAIGNSQIRTLKASWPTGDNRTWQKKTAAPMDRYESLWTCATSSSHSMQHLPQWGHQVRCACTQQQVQSLSSMCFRDASIVLSRCFDQFSMNFHFDKILDVSEFLDFHVAHGKPNITAGLGTSYHSSWLSQSPVFRFTLYVAWKYKLEPRLIRIHIWKICWKFKICSVASIFVTSI